LFRFIIRADKELYNKSLSRQLEFIHDILLPKLNFNLLRDDIASNCSAQLKLTQMFALPMLRGLPPFRLLGCCGLPVTVDCFSELTASATEKESARPTRNMAGTIHPISPVK
jgi:hypothetical protein